jgi:hypothetical protein
MKLNLKDEPKEWRRSMLLLLLAFALFSSLLRWRHHLANEKWLAIMSALALVAVAAVIQPRWFRGYHLLSMRLGFVISRILGRVFLTLFFGLIVTPLGRILQRAGKDPLQLQRSAKAESYWQAAKECGPLDRLF